MTIKLENIRPSDKITVEFTVKDVESYGCYALSASPAGRDAPIYGLMPEYITTHTPAPREFEPGDPVLIVGWGSPTQSATFVCMDGGKIVVRITAPFGTEYSAWNPDRVRHDDSSEKP